MSPVLLHIYGPFAIQSFGLMIAIGLLITLFLLDRDEPLQKLVSPQQISNIFCISIIAGIVGGRIWFLMTNSSTILHWTDCFAVWTGGLSILGATICIPLTLLIYLSWNNIPTMALLDRLALYAPLLQSISRCGCFFAGCCYGLPTSLPWGIRYTDPNSLAPLHVTMHPTQIYSSIALACIFIILWNFDRYKKKKCGQIFLLYIILTTAERFSVDFLRADQELFVQLGYLKILSIQQILALFLCTSALLAMIFITIYKKNNESI